MAAAQSKNQPFAIQLDVELLDRLNEPVRAGKAPNVSALIRDALERLDVSRVVVLHPAQLLISVRLPAAKRQELRRAALRMNTSIGQLVRIAVDAYLPTLEAETTEAAEAPAQQPAPELPAPAAVPEVAAQPAKPRPRRKPKPTSKAKPKSKPKAKPKAAPAKRKKEPARAPKAAPRRAPKTAGRSAKRPV